MSILIKGMEMPKAGRLTLQISADGSVYVVNRCNITAETYTTEAVHVPPHGRLIDADALKNLYHYNTHDSDIDKAWTGNIRRSIDSAPTVIEAEEGE